MHGAGCAHWTVMQGL